MSVADVILVFWKLSYQHLKVTCSSFTPIDYALSHHPFRSTCAHTRATTTPLTHEDAEELEPLLVSSWTLSSKTRITFSWCFHNLRTSQVSTASGATLLNTHAHLDAFNKRRYRMTTASSRLDSFVNRRLRC